MSNRTGIPHAKIKLSDPKSGLPDVNWYTWFNNLVNNGVVANVAPGGAATSAASVTTLSATTGTFTAPSNGAVVLLGFVNTTGTFSTSSLSASLAGLTDIANIGGQSTFSASFASLPMTAGQSSTFTITGSCTTTVNMVIGVIVFFLPGA